jgi:peptidoglycan/LPS O-acetylase OafA/YrhL
MKLDNTSIQRLQLLRFPLIVGVIFIHAYSSTVALSTGQVGLLNVSPTVMFIRDFISQGMARISVPLFFLMSGYLFFRVGQFSLIEYVAKLKRRIHTLVIPYLFWNSLVLGFLAAAQLIPLAQPYFSGANQVVGDYTWIDYFEAFIGWRGYPISFQFWFIRDLMILVLCTPVIYLIHKKAPYIFLGLLGLCWVCDYEPIAMPAIEGMMFFSSGAILGLRRVSLFATDRLGPLFSIIYIALLFVSTLTRGAPFNPYLHKAGIIFGIVTVLYATKPVLKHERISKTLEILGMASFFIFAVHEPALKITRKIIYRTITVDSSGQALLIYLLLPLFIITIAMIAYRILSVTTPKLLSIITGGRSSDRIWNLCAVQWRLIPTNRHKSQAKPRHPRSLRPQAYPPISR